MQMRVWSVFVTCALLAPSIPTVAFAQDTAMDTRVLPEVGAVLPLKVVKGYPVSFLSNWEGTGEGFRADSLNTLYGLANYYDVTREMQVRQSDDGVTWGDWVNVEGPTDENAVTSAEAGTYNLAWSYMVSDPVVVEKDFVQVRHRVNNALNHIHYSAEDAEPEGHFISEWKTYDIEVVSDAHEDWIDTHSYADVTLSYLDQFAPLKYTEMGWDRPDYFHLPYDSDAGPKVYPAKLDGFPYDTPSEAWQDAFMDRVNFYRRLSGVSPAVRGTAEVEQDAQMAALFFHLSGDGDHYAMDPDDVPEDHPFRDYFPERGHEVRFAAYYGLISFMGNQTIWENGGDLTCGSEVPSITSEFCEPVMDWFDEQGDWNFPVGHRRNLLNPTATNWGFGSTLATVLAEEYAPNASEPGVTFGYNKYPETHMALTEYGQMYYYGDLTALDGLIRDNGVFFPAPGFIPYQLVSPRVSAEAVHAPLEMPNWDKAYPPVGYDSDLDDTNPVIQARIWRNGVELNVQMDYWYYQPMTGYLNYTAQIMDTFEEELRADYPWFESDVRNIGSQPLQFSSVKTICAYPRPDDGRDEVRVVIEFHADAETQAAFGVAPVTQLLEYTFYPCTTDLAFGDEDYKDGNWVKSPRVGWYTVDQWPWLWLDRDQHWAYTATTADGPCLWNYDPQIRRWAVAGGADWWYVDGYGWMQRQEVEDGSIWWWSDAEQRWLKPEPMA